MNKEKGLQHVQMPNIDSSSFVHLRFSHFCFFPIVNKSIKYIKYS